jgi:hypothetical protein
VISGRVGVRRKRSMTVPRTLMASCSANAQARRSRHWRGEPDGWWCAQRPRAAVYEPSSAAGVALTGRRMHAAYDVAGEAASREGRDRCRTRLMSNPTRTSCQSPCAVFEFTELYQRWGV